MQGGRVLLCQTAEALLKKIWVNNDGYIDYIVIDKVKRTGRNPSAMDQGH